MIRANFQPLEFPVRLYFIGHYGPIAKDSPDGSGFSFSIL